MQKLHPRAVWLFFIGYFIKAWFFILFFGYFFVIFFRSYMKITAEFPGGSQNIIMMQYDYYNIFWLFLIPILYIVIIYVWARLSYHFYRYELTENGFKKEHGVIWKKYVTIPYDRIQNVDIYRGLVTRLLGLSDLQIQTAGMSGAAYYSEGRLPGLSKKDAEKIRDELINRAKQSKNQGL